MIKRLAQRPKNHTLAPKQRRKMMLPITGSTPPENATVIYVLGDAEGEGAGKHVKIGRSDIPDLRMHQHQQRGPLAIEMKELAFIWGHASDEGALKDYFKKNNATLRNGSNEWLNGELPLVRNWIRFLRGQAFTALTIDDLERTPYVDSRHWLPGAKNEQGAVQTVLSFSGDKWHDVINVDDETAGDYFTDPILTEAARMAMGAIDLDPASCRLANEGVKARRYFGALQDGLQWEWEGRIWLNPPFSEWNKWAPKALEEWRSGRIVEMCIFITANATTAKQVYDLVNAASAIFISCGRFSCWGPKSTTAPEGCFIFYYGPHNDRFAQAFKLLGTVFFH